MTIKLLQLMRFYNGIDDQTTIADEFLSWYKKWRHYTHINDTEP